MSLERRIFGKTGTAVSVLGFGGAPVGLLEADPQDANRLLNLLLDRGVNLIDTAAAYRGSEELIAGAIGHRRHEFFLVSKCGGSLPDVPAREWTPEMITLTVDRSLRRLRTDRIDLMLLHSCDLATLRRGDCLAALLRARDAGKVRFVGYSGDNQAVAYAAALPEVAVVQSSINVADQVNIDGLLPVARANQVGVMAKRPLANAAWKPISEQRGVYQSYARTYTERLAAMQLHPMALGAASWPELALRFTLSQPGVTTAIVGTTNPASVEANLAAAAKGPLTAESIAAIRAAFHRADPRGAWIGQT